MAGTGIPFPASSTPGENPGEGLGRLINAYSEAYTDGGAQQQIRHRRSAGLRKWADIPKSGPRGFYALDNVIFGAFKDSVVKIDKNGVPTTLSGALAGTKPVTWARNNKSPTPDLVAVSEGQCYLVTDTTVSAYPDADLPSPNSVSFMDGYFIWTIGDGRIFASELNSTDVNALSFGRADSNSDALLRGFVFGGQFFACGANTIEVYANAGTAPFPLARAAVIPVGMVGPFACAGFQVGWGLSPLFVASDYTVRQMNGLQLQKVSTDDVEHAISHCANPEDIQCFCYTVGGNAFFVVKAPEFTWEYNVTTEQWNERASYGSSNWRGAWPVLFDRRWRTGDDLSAVLFTVDERYYFEGTSPLVAHIESGPVKAFPQRLMLPGAEFDITVGQGTELGQDPIETDPRCMISWSHDGGAKWSVPVERSLGKQGQHRFLPRVSKLGLTTAHGVRVRLRVSDPVPFTFRGATIDAIPRRK